MSPRAAAPEPKKPAGDGAANRLGSASPGAANRLGSASPGTANRLGSASPGAKPSLTRALDLSTSVLLAVAIGVVVAAATPALLQAGGVEIPVAAPAESVAPLALPHRPPEILAHPDPPELFAPGTIYEPDDDSPQAGSEVASGDEAHAGRAGLARGALTLRANPSADAPILGHVRAGEIVDMMWSADDWVFVRHQTREGSASNAVAGWVKRSEIAVR